MLSGTDTTQPIYTDPQSAYLLKLSRSEDGNVVGSGVVRKTSILPWLEDPPSLQSVGGLRLIFVATDIAQQPVLPFANHSEYEAATHSMFLAHCVKPFMDLGWNSVEIRSQGSRMIRVHGDVNGKENQAWVIKTHNCMTTIMISYMPQTNTVSAFGIFKDRSEVENLLEELQNQRIYACHPMLIPVLMTRDGLGRMLSIYGSLFNDFRQLELQAGMRNFSVPLEDSFIADTYPVIRSSTDLKARSIDLFSYLQPFRSCMIDPVAEGLEETRPKANSSLSISDQSRRQILIDDAGLQACLESTRQDQKIAVSRTESLAAKMDSTLYALQIMLAQRDSKLNMQIAEDSRRLAYESKRNADFNLAIAQQSMKIAEATKRDSSSMKAITFLTTVFLPGTFVATLLGTSMVEWTSDDFWRYWVITIPLTVGFLGIWVAYMMMIERRGRRSIAKAEFNFQEQSGSSKLLASLGKA